MPITRDLDRFLGAAERFISLLDRCRPLNVTEELDALEMDYLRGQPRRARLVHAVPPDLSKVVRTLDSVIEGLRDRDPLLQLYRERAEELWLEAQVVQAIGTKDFQRHARRRFMVDDTEDGARAEVWAGAWMELPREPDAQHISSDDSSNPESLVSCLRREVGRARLPVRVVVTSGLLSSAATGQGVIHVRAGHPLSAHDARRIAHHEIEGHARPRVSAVASGLGILVVGTAGASDDEEGRALLLERRAELLGVARKRELALRHWAAQSVIRGADSCETVQGLRDRGAGLRESLAMALRVHRGGGLAREIVYLPALSRISRVFERLPRLEDWFHRGRVSASAAFVLQNIHDATAA